MPAEGVRQIAEYAHSGRAGAADHYPSVVDVRGGTARSAERAQVCHHAVLPEEGAARSAAHHLTHVVDSVCRASPGSRREVSHRAILPKEPVINPGRDNVSAAHNLAGLIDGETVAMAATKGA